MESKQLGLFDAPLKQQEEKSKISTHVVMDFETGGVDPKTNGLASVGVMWLDENLEEVDRFYFILYEPDKKYEAEALRVNGLTMEQLERDGLRPETFVPLFHRLFDGKIMVNHNSAFDCAFLRRLGWNIQESCDTIAMRQELYPYKRAKLFMACQDEGVEVKDAHNAMADVVMTAELFRKYAAKNPKYKTPSKIDWMRFKR